MDLYNAEPFKLLPLKHSTVANFKKISNMEKKMSLDEMYHIMASTAHQFGIVAFSFFYADNKGHMGDITGCSPLGKEAYGDMMVELQDILEKFIERYGTTTEKRTDIMVIGKQNGEV